MIEVIGWIAIAICGAMGAYIPALVLFSWGGLKGLARGHFAGVIAVVIWAVLFVYMSPITVGVTP